MRTARLSRRTARSLRRLQLLAVLPLAAGIIGILAAPHAGAQSGVPDPGTTSGASTTTNPNVYTLSSLANALDAVVTDPSLPLSGDLAIELGPWGASASEDSLGESMSDAGAPYAPSIASLPGTVNGIGAGDLPPLPPLPGYVSASYPSAQSNTEAQAGYDITATAGANTAKGTVSLGVQPSGSPSATIFASALSTSNSDGSVEAVGIAGVDALDIGQLIDVGNVSSSLEMTEQANSAPVVTSKTNLGTITLLGKVTGLLGTEASVLGVNTPIPLTTTLISTLNGLFSKSGLSVTYLPETFTYTDGTSSTGSTPQSSKTIQAIDSGALKITFSKNIPSQGLVVVSVTLGRVYVSATDTPGFSSGVGTVNSGGGDLNPVSVPSLTSPISSLGSQALTPSSTSPTPTSSTTPTAPAGHHTLAASPAYAVEQGPPTQSLYLVLVLGALAMFLGAQAVRFLAVRLAMSGRST
ncbi:MAG TPA: hypothetical protein VGF87_10735 [Acidimicrobiales bacterium]|jgi:hypothetical protein